MNRNRCGLSAVPAPKGVTTLGRFQSFPAIWPAIGGACGEPWGELLLHVIIEVLGQGVRFKRHGSSL
jgi:hypothetical protein